jgi:hypothetical protein
MKRTVAKRGEERERSWKRRAIGRREENGAMDGLTAMSIMNDRTFRRSLVENKKDMLSSLGREGERERESVQPECVDEADLGGRVF